MQSDLPHTLYLRDEKDKRKKKGGTVDYEYNPNDPAIKLQMDAIRKRKERMEAEGKKVEYTMDEIFNTR